MPKLLIIAGAGASYDSDPARAPKSGSDFDGSRPPLADHLFLPHFRKLQADYPRMAPIIDDLATRPNGQTVEDVLSRLQQRNDDNRFRAAQLMSARFYIHKVVKDTEHHWFRNNRFNTNWMTLLHRISD